MIRLPHFSRLTQDFIRPLKAIRLRDDAKTRIRADLSAFADLHAVEAPVIEQRSSLSGLFARSRSMYAGALMLTLVVAGGTQASLAAEGAVPGDLLYPIKVSVNEPVAFVLSMSPVRKAELSARFASNRVDEAAKLAARDELDTERADELATRFDTHVDTLAKETVALESKGELGVSLAVRADLSQKVAERTEEIANERVAAVAAPAAKESEARFSQRVAMKSKVLATTRERLNAALATDASATLAAADEDASRLLFTTLSLGTTSATSTMATSTATSTSMQLFSPLFGSPSSNR